MAAVGSRLFEAGQQVATAAWSKRVQNVPERQALRLYSCTAQTVHPLVQQSVNQETRNRQLPGSSMWHHGSHPPLRIAALKAVGTTANNSTRAYRAMQTTDIGMEQAVDSIADCETELGSSSRASSGRGFAGRSAAGGFESPWVAAQDAQRERSSREMEEAYREVEELKAELEDLCSEILAMYRDGDALGASELADANLAAVEEQLRDGVVGVEQVAMLTTLAWAYHLMESAKGSAVLDKLLQVVDDVEQGLLLLPDVLFSAAQQFYALDRKEVAVRLLERTLTVQDLFGAAESPEGYVNVVERLALTYMELERPQEAVALQQTSLRKLQTRTGMTPALFARLDTLMARAMLELDDVDGAELALTRAVSSWEKANGKDSLEVGIVLIDKADVLHAKGKVMAALSSLERAVCIIEAKTRPGEDALLDSMLGETYRNLLQLYKHTDRKKAAHEMLNRAVARLETAAAPLELHMCNFYLELAETHLDAGLWSVVERLCQQVLSIVSEAVPPDSIEVLKPLDLLSECLLREGRFEEARELAEAHLHVCEKNFPAQHVEVGISTARLGRVLCKQKEWEEAESLLRRAIVNLEAEYGTDNLALLGPLGDIIEVLQRLDRLDDAFKYGEQFEKLKAAALQELADIEDGML